MLNFAVGPVQSENDVRALGALDVPYFRTPEFSTTMLENEQMLCELAKAPEGSRAVFVTGSGTAGMETVVAGTLSAEDKALVVDGGSFGHRFVQLLELHNIPHTVIKLNYGSPLTAADLERYQNQGYTAFLVNLGETSQGILYDAELISAFCKENNLFWIADCVSSFLADPFDMASLGVDVMITGSQKALACPPGISPIVLSQKAVKKIAGIKAPCMYLDLNLLLQNGERGQTPFTPAVQTLLQIHKRLSNIVKAGGVDAENVRIAALAKDFRERAQSLPFEMRLVSPSNAVTFLSTGNYSAKTLFQVLKNEYGMWICPNGGENADTSFRVGHIGAHDVSDNAVLVAAIHDVQRRGLLTTRE